MYNTVNCMSTIDTNWKSRGVHRKRAKIFDLPCSYTSKVSMRFPISAVIDAYTGLFISIISGQALERRMGFKKWIDSLSYAIFGNDPKFFLHIVCRCFIFLCNVSMSKYLHSLGSLPWSLAWYLIISKWV